MLGSDPPLALTLALLDAEATVVEHEGVPTWMWVAIGLGIGLGVLAAVILRGRGEGLIPLAPPDPSLEESESVLDGQDRTNGGKSDTGVLEKESAPDSQATPESGDQQGA